MCLKISRKTECAHNCRPEGSTFNQQICALDVYNGQLYCSPLLLPSNKFDCPSVSCPAFFFVTLLHFQISAIHSEGISIDTNDSKKYKNKTIGPYHRTQRPSQMSIYLLTSTIISIYVYVL